MLKSIALIVGLAVVIVIGLVVITRLRSELQGDEGKGSSKDDLLASFQDAYEAGEIDTEEYEQVRNSLDRKTRGGSRPTVSSSITSSTGGQATSATQPPAETRPESPAPIKPTGLSVSDDGETTSEPPGPST